MDARDESPKEKREVQKALPENIASLPREDAMLAEMAKTIVEKLSLPEKNRAQATATVARTLRCSELLVARFHSGPLPPPDVLAQYDRVIPNGAERIMNMAEQQADHRQKNETACVNAMVSESKRGSAFGLLIAVLGIIGATWAALTACDWKVVASICGPVLASMTTAFIVGRRSREKA